MLHVVRVIFKIEGMALSLKPQRFPALPCQDSQPYLPEKVTSLSQGDSKSPCNYHNYPGYASAIPA
jgi:hypothetical protein